MQAHLSVMRSYWFRALLRCVYSRSLLLSLFLSLSFHHFYPNPALCLFLFYLFHPSFFLPRSLHLRAVRRDGVHFCYLIFIVESFAASLSGVKFTPVAVRGRKLTRALKTTSKNDYSEINNNDITARHDWYARKWFSSADLDSLSMWCLISASKLTRW